MVCGPSLKSYLMARVQYPDVEEEVASDSENDFGGYVTSPEVADLVSAFPVFVPTF